MFKVCCLNTNTGAKENVQWEKFSDHKHAVNRFKDQRVKQVWARQQKFTFFSQDSVWLGKLKKSQSTGGLSLIDKSTFYSVSSMSL